MQDDLLMDKSNAQPQNQNQQQDPATAEPPSSPTPTSEAPSSEDQVPPVQSSKEKGTMESPILPGLSFHQGQEPGGTSLSPSFGSTWSTGTAGNVDDGFFPGIPSVNGTMLFQNFPHHVNPVFGGSFSAQMSLAVLGSKASPSPASSSSAWNNQQNAAWNTAASNPWSGVQASRDPRRAVGVGVPSPLNPISPMKKPYSSNVIAPPKFPRAGPLTKSWMEDNAFRTDNGNSLLPFQDRNRPFDAFSLHSLENSLMDMIRTDHDKGKRHPAGLLAINVPRSYGRRRGRSSLFPFEDGFLDEGHGEQSLTPGIGSPTRCQNGERIERYSRKVFVGGLPPDIDEDEITNSFRRYGHLVVDWPHKAESKSYFPPKGYAFLLFQEETSVQALIDACIEEDGKLYLCVSSPTIKDKPVQIRPWNLSDSDFVMDGSQPLDPRKTIFVGGVPRPLRAVELAMIMDRLYGGVCYAGIDTDPELKYPKGAGRVAFSNQQSYIAAISARFVQLQHNDIDKRVEVKPYVLDDQMCDECQGARCGGKFAPFFCANVTCLQYYCEYCWASIHSRAGREFHKPLVKEGGDRPRHVSFRWS
uniref:Cytoplasmic polyadenylation element binding protein 3 n=1 Tax=Scleropages formosus TaxID=113540 RepID=A0A8C9SWS3_SCLFO